jgi:hypothetical protein
LNGINLALLEMDKIKAPYHRSRIDHNTHQGGPIGPPLSLWRAEMTRQTSDSKKRDGDANITVLFGTDEHGKPRAAWFEAANPDLITKAAAAMKLQLLRPVTASQIELAKKLPVGRIHANGTGFVPPIRGDLYSALQLAAEPPQQSGATASTFAPSPAAAPGAPAHGLPKDWDSIEVGHLVIAQENMIEGWWEAIVIATDNDMLTLRWRDYPKVPPVTRHRTAVALMKPTAADA